MKRRGKKKAYLTQLETALLLNLMDYTDTNGWKTEAEILKTNKERRELKYLEKDGKTALSKVNEILYYGSVIGSNLRNTINEMIKRGFVEQNRPKIDDRNRPLKRGRHEWSIRLKKDYPTYQKILWWICKKQVEALMKETETLKARQVFFNSNYFDTLLQDQEFQKETRKRVQLQDKQMQNELKRKYLKLKEQQKDIEKLTKRRKIAKN